MDNTNQNRIGCRLGEKIGGNNGSRTKIIDPNAFYGETDSSRNIPVRLEDLTISVKLTTKKRGRTSITNDSDKNQSTVKEQQGATINFIEGSDINGKKVLTTKFTELTTSFETDTFNPETFGITNIDIDFNSSYTPMIKIDFIDVRGSSIFQNEEELLNDSGNKYATFFEFPYPLFELEIKGYYGLPVTYCLHMLKFNSKFNSQTGNFEISCEFIGYTYAMLSDMLIGVLKAIPFTKIGGDKFKKYNENKDPKILNLVELKNKISLIPESIKKAALKSEEAKDINSFKEALEILNNLEAAINSFGLEYTTTKDETTTTITIYDFVIMENLSFSAERQEKYNDFDKTIKELIVQYNNLNIGGAKINEIDLATPIILNDLTKKLLEPESTLTIVEDSKLKDIAALESFKKDLLNYLNTNFTAIASDYVFRLMDLRSRFKLIKDQRELIEKTLNDTNKYLANEIKNSITETLGFNPTVRNMIEVFTCLIEVFMETVYEVSRKAELNQVRKELFTTVFSGKKEGSDYNKDDPNFYPWPAYSEKETQSNNYSDKYLGANTILKNRISDIPELEFIDDLLQAFLTASRLEQSLDLLNAGSGTLFFPVNPLDTKLFNDKAGNPYAVKELQNIEQVKRLMIIRGMIYLSYTNNPLYMSRGENGDIRKMAILEANTMLSAIINPTLKVSLKNLKIDDLVKTFGTINGVDSKLMFYDATDKKYYYDYFFSNGEKTETKVLPINSDLNDYVPIALGNPRIPNTLSNMVDDGILFLTNYNSGVNYTKTVNELTKQEDYGIYVKMFTNVEYATDLTLVDTSIDTNSVIDLINLSTGNIANAGFNSFGGIFGIQDFGKITFGPENAPENTPAMYIFYRNDSKNRNGLADSRAQSASINGFKNNNSVFDGVWKRNTLIPTPNDYSEFMKTKKNGRLIHESVGSSRFKAIDINTAPNNISYPYIQQLTSIVQTFKIGGLATGFSLFGSKWYYLQKNAECTYNDNLRKLNVEKYAKALLFLNTLPFNISYDNYDPFGSLEIKHLFDIKGGFVHAPRFWVAYVGAVLWWLSEEDPIIVDGKIVGGGRGIKDPVIWKKTCGVNASSFKAPAPGYYFPRIIDENIIIENDSVIRALPEQVKNEFQKVFFDFVNGTSVYVSWETIYNGLEITNQTPTEFCGFLDRMRYKTTETTPNGQTGFLGYDGTNNNYNFYSDKIIDNLINYDNYNIITTLAEGASFSALDKHQFLLELNGGSDVGKALIKAFDEEIIIANTGYGIWLGKDRINVRGDGDINSGEDLDLLRRPIGISEGFFKEYYETYISVISNAVSGLTLTNQVENEINQVFGTNNKDDVKLMLYRHCKNIYDKWLGGITDESNIIFQCGDNNRDGSNRKKIDAAMAKKYNPLSSSPRLIDSFRFVTRSFKDIGNELYIDPTPLGETISDFPNTSATGVISGLLSDNKFEFLALPTFINYRDDEMLQSVFTPFAYDEAITTCGPTFVCVYTGQKSNKLDLKSGKYPNDGFDIRCDKDGNPDVSIPSDYAEPLNDNEDPVSVFVVNYSQQNQNIFKDITLDQSEFTESEESLKIVQDISTKGFENNPSIGGQNMYNIYAVRSYSAEIEMLGNPMIQPMMYFQLNNVPMFHGAYMIIKTRHNIKPNYMSTWFTGTRIKSIESPIIDIAEAYMSLIETLDLSTAGKSKASNVRATEGKNYVTDFYSDLKSSIPSDKTIIGVPLQNPKVLTQTAENEITAWKNGTLDEKDAVTILKKYADKTPGVGAQEYSSNAQPWSAVFISYVMLAGDPNFMKSTLHYSYVSSAMKGVNGYEAFPLKSGLKIKPEVGCLFCKPRSGAYTSSHCDVLYKIDGNTAFLVGGNLSDSIKTFKIGLFDGYITDSSDVKDYILIILKTNNKYYNKKNIIGVADFNTGGENEKTVVGPTADYWSLVAICAAENFKENQQGMADVAQSIYNRLNTPGKPYGNSIKEIITAPKQYEPTFKNISDWKKINSKATSIVALRNSKNISAINAEEYINNSVEGINNTQYRQNSLDFVGTRTEFLANAPTSSQAKGVVQRTPDKTNNAFYWRYAGIALINSQPIAGPNFLV
jgi:hypothetical protein